MATIIKERERKSYTKQEMNFYTKDTNEVRFEFPVVNGEVVPCVYNDIEKPCSEEECTWWENYLFAKENDDLYGVIEEHTSYYTEPAIALCECGSEIYLNYDAEECPHCGRLHNLFGQELLPRHMWEREW